MVYMNYVYHITETFTVTPSSEIDKALKIKEEYYEYKKQHAD